MATTAPSGRQVNSRQCLGLSHLGNGEWKVQSVIRYELPSIYKTPSEAPVKLMHNNYTHTEKPFIPRETRWVNNQVSHPRNEKQ